MTQADRDALVAAAQVLLRLGMDRTFLDTGEDAFKNADIAELLFECAKWDLNPFYYLQPEERPREGLTAAPACGIDCQYKCARDYDTTDECFDNGRKWPRLVAYTSPADNVRLSSIYDIPVVNKGVATVRLHPTSLDEPQKHRVGQLVDEWMGINKNNFLGYNPNAAPRLTFAEIYHESEPETYDEAANQSLCDT